jgi:hypothetical protein
MSQLFTDTASPTETKIHSQTSLILQDDKIIRVTALDVLHTGV